MKLLSIPLALFTWFLQPLHAEEIYGTDFEAPEFKVGNFGTGDGLKTQSSKWSIFAKELGVDCAQLAIVQPDEVKSGKQALTVRATHAHQTHAGISTCAENSATQIDFEGDIRLGSSPNPSDWQLAVGDESAKGGFVGGFNIGANNGILQLITPGYKQTSPTIKRDTWHRVRLSFDLEKQTFQVVVDGSLVVADVAFLARAERLRIFQLATSAKGDDTAQLDNFSIRPSSSKKVEAPPILQENRIWTDAETGRTLEGILKSKSADGSEVKIKRKDNGSVVTLKTDRLVEANRDFIKTWKP